MTTRRNCTIAGAGLLAPAVAALILAAPASAQCDGSGLDCPGGGGSCGLPMVGLCEGEACLESGADTMDTTNTGCNAETPLLTDFTEVTAVGTGPNFPDTEVFCGGISTFQVGPQCKTDDDCDPPDVGSCVNGLCTPADFRDTDWWRVPVTVLETHDTDGDGRVLLNLRFRSEFDANVFIIDIEDLELCDTTTTLDSAVALEAETGDCGTPVEIEAVVDFSESPNGLAVVATTDGVFGTGVPCDQRYLMELWATDVLAACDVGAGPCNTANGSPGCEDAECCALVCEEVDPSCCIITWGPQRADGAINAIGCAFEPYACENPDLTEPDCCDAASASPPLLVTDGTVHDFDTTDTNSDGAPNENPLCSADTPTGLGKDIWFRYEANETGTLTISTCRTTTPPAFDTLIEVYDGGNVGDAYDCEEIKGRAVELLCNDTGGQFGFDPPPCVADPEDSAHLHFEVSVGTQYIIRMAGFNNEVDFGPGSITFNFIPGEPIFDTAAHEVVLFDGAGGGNLVPAVVGFSSGQLSETGLDTERRTAQAIEIPPLPAGATQWQITEVLLAGFQADGTINDTVTLEFFDRTPGATFNCPDDPAKVWPGVEPTPAESLLTVAVPTPVATEDFRGPDGNDDGHSFDLSQEGPGIALAPGPYWLTVYAANDEVPFVASNFAWFLNAPEGVNNFCTADSPPDYPDPADPTQLGCSTSPDCTPSMLRARIYPPVDPDNDDTGFRAYQLSDQKLDVDPDNDPTPDAEDLYNTSMQIRAIPAAGAPPCPYDCQNSGPDGEVGINDFLDLLASWQQKGVPCDVDPDDTGAGINDFLALLAAWGPCPK